MFADESGDTGLLNSPSKYFVLTALVMHELEWKNCLLELVAFRKQLRADFGLKVRQEIHASAFITRPKELSSIPKHKRLEMLRLFADKIAQLRSVNVISVVVDKQTKATGYDVFEKAWQALIQRFENTIGYKNFPAPVTNKTWVLFLVIKPTRRN